MVLTKRFRLPDWIYAKTQGDTGYSLVRQHGRKMNFGGDWDFLLLFRRPAQGRNRAEKSNLDDGW